MCHSTSELLSYGRGKFGVEYSPKSSVRLNLVRGNLDRERSAVVKQKGTEERNRITH